MRTGVLAKKLGMTRVYSESRVHNSVTVLRMPDSVVLGHRIESKDGYNALILGFEGAKIKSLKKPQKQFYAKAKKEPMKKIKEFRVSKDNFVNQGAVLAVSHFVVGQYVDVKSNSIGKGFAGAMKRHNFGGLRASHGVSISHRSHGSTGQCQGPGKVFKGKKMAGHMGAVRVTTQNLQVVKTDVARGLIMIKGAVPGSKGGWVTIKDSVKKPLVENVPFPAALRSDVSKVNETSQPEGGEL